MAENSIMEQAARLIGRHLEQGAGAGSTVPTEPRDRPAAGSCAPQFAWSHHLPLVRALLTVLRNPTDPMIDIGARTINGLQPTPEAMAETIWQRMIDAALDETS